LTNVEYLIIYSHQISHKETYLNGSKRPNNRQSPYFLKVWVLLFMIEKVVEKNGKKVTEVRSDAGKLLFIKTPKGYEIKCARTKQICLVKYEEMIADCLACWNGGSKECQDILIKLKKDNNQK